MGNVASDSQVEEIIKTADNYLKDDQVGGYRLNTNFNEVLMNMGRAYGFAYGHKENGAMFSHMAVMYSNALYKRGYAEAGNEVISSIYKQSINYQESKIYPGIPEYINNRGEGLYHYLTGSASWLLLTMVTQVYGVRGDLGDLVLDPKLMAEDFDQNSEAKITTVFADRDLEISYHNPEALNYKDYEIKEILIDNQEIDFVKRDKSVMIKRNILTDKTDVEKIKLEIKLK